jgi:AbiU2
VTDISAEEILEQCTRCMGADLGCIYYALRNDVIRLQMKWNQYRLLYAASPQQIELLNQAAGHFFGLIQEIMLEDVVLHLARLSDRERTAGRDNLSLQRLPALVLDGKLASEVAELTKRALNACKFTRDWRNRHLAHRDLNLALASSVDPLPGVSRAEIETALVSIRSVLNRISKHYMDSETAYQLVIANGRDASALIRYIGSGLRADEKRLERWKNGEFLPEDIENRTRI